MAINNGRFFYHQNILTIVAADTSGQYNAGYFNSKLAALSQNHNISRAMRENAVYHNIPVNNFISLAHRMAHPSHNHHSPDYKSNTSTGAVIRIESHYGKSLGSNTSITAITNTLPLLP